MSGKKEAFTDAENRVLRDALRRYRKDKDLTQREMGALLDIEQQNVGRLESAARTGMGRGTANALARLLGYRDAEEFLIAEGVLAEMQQPPPARSSTGASWSTRDAAVRVARVMHIDERAIHAVLARFTDDSARHRPMKWWINKFGIEELELQAEPQIPPAPKSIPSAKAGVAALPAGSRRKRAAHER